MVSASLNSSSGMGTVLQKHFDPVLYLEFASGGDFSEDKRF